MTYKELIDIDSYDEFKEQLEKANIPFDDKVALWHKRFEHQCKKHGLPERRKDDSI